MLEKEIQRVEEDYPNHPWEEDSDIL